MLKPVFKHNCMVHLRADYIDDSTILAIVRNGGSIMSHDTSFGQHIVTDGYMIHFPPNTVLLANSLFIDSRGYVEEVNILGVYSAWICVNGRLVSVIQKVEENKNA